MRSAEIYDYPAAKHRGYWSGASDFKKITKRDWAKLHLLYKLDIMLLVRPWNITDIRGDWKEWKKVSTEEYAADYREMGELFTSLGIEWCVTTHAIEGTPQTKLDSSSPVDFEIIYRQAENVVSNGGVSCSNTMMSAIPAISRKRKNTRTAADARLLHS